ncbi:hypothetical protein VTK73DRAFT_9662 [Phialemonium thermophilum]|uniref:Prokaryotic-type class I peptide chain release factors domain-containing protein n=1 Tax=Phialemonium thermophilum TaxID=223376 RepID=A0ABR3XJM9_9PEZI
MLLLQRLKTRIYHDIAMFGRTSIRLMQHQAYEASFDPDALAEARTWYQSFRLADIPKGSTTFSRSSGPGGQHVNKTETKATTSWPVSQLIAVLPALLHGPIRTSRYYARRTDSIVVQAQSQRSRAANMDENHQKLFEEIQRLYSATIPGETSPEKKQKHDNLKKSANEARIRTKKMHSLRKASRKGSWE